MISIRGESSLARLLIYIYIYMCTYIYTIHNLQQTQTQIYYTKRAERTNYVRIFGMFCLLDTQKGRTLKDITKIIYKNMFRTWRIFS